MCEAWAVYKYFAVFEFTFLVLGNADRNVSV